MNRIAAVVAGLSLAFAGTSATLAATINVPGDHATIQGAINASSHGDVIAIAAGTYYEHTLNPNGKAITIGSASGNLDVTIDAQQGGSVFVFNSGETNGTEIKDLVITGGSSDFGGGIFCWDSNPTISNCTIEDNTGDYYGGGIYCESGSPTITGCTIEDNTGDYSGGIYCLNSNPTITDCTIENNSADTYGGGIFCNNSNPTITNCTIEGNTAWYGGGIYCFSGSDPTISNCTISGNTADYGGGGIYCNNSSSFISGSVICGNSPDQLYGIGLPEGSLVSDSCDIVSNTFGACCLNGTCITATESDCTAAGGTYAGDEVACGDAGCATPPVMGACCVASGCIANSNDDCTALGGTWLGEDSSCDDCAPTCQGDANADGVVDIFDLLKVIDGWGTCP